MTADKDVPRRLRSVVARLGTTMLESSGTDVAALDGWTAGDVAAHLRCVAALNLAFATGTPPTGPIRSIYDMAVAADVETIGEMNAASLAAVTERNPALLARDIERDVRAIADACVSQPRRDTTWVGGVRLPVIGVGAHMLLEMLVHGHDIGVAGGAGFDVADEEAQLVFEHFLANVVEGAPASFYGASRRGVRPVRWQLRLRGSTPQSYAFSFADGELSTLPPAAPVDLHITARPAAMLLVMFERKGPIAAALRGQVVVWGRRPWRLPRLMQALQTA